MNSKKPAPKSLAVAEFGKSTSVTIYIYADKDSSQQATLNIQAISESEPTKKAVATIRLSR